MNGYVGFYKGKRYEIYADTSYHAQQAIAQKYHIKKAYDIAVVLAEKDGKPVTHLPLMNPKVNVDRLAIEAKKKYKDDVKAGHTDGVEYWAGYAGAAFMMSNPGGLGIKIAQAAHNEGRKAFARGVTEGANPYNAKAEKDSDEWLRYQNWRNGWTFAWFNRKYTKYNRNPGRPIKTLLNLQKQQKTADFTAAEWTKVRNYKLKQEGLAGVPDWAQWNRRNPGAVRATPDTKMGQLIRMLKTHQATHFVYRQGRVLVDMQTANVLMKAYQALTDRNKAKFERMLESWAGLRKLVDLSWKSTIQNPMKMMTAEIRKKLPKLYSQEHVKDPIAYVKFFTPWTNWTWWGLEWDQKDRFFGYVSGHENELGYFSLKELESIRGPWGLKVERDLSFRPTPLSEIKRRHP